MITAIILLYFFNLIAVITVIKAINTTRGILFCKYTPIIIPKIYDIATIKSGLCILSPFNLPYVYLV